MTTTDKLKRLKNTSANPRIQNSKIGQGKGVTEEFINKMKWYIKIYLE